VSNGSADTRAIEINQALAVWRQGDLALDEKWFVHIGDGNVPLTAAAHDAGPGMQALVVECDGLVVVTQTCDVVRDCRERHYVEVAPLLRVSEDEARRVAQGHSPQYASIAARLDLVADLDRTMTIEKSILATWSRTPGWTTDAESRRLAQALARKRERFAFPDDFVTAVSKLRARIIKKHGRDSNEGQALGTLIEIRATASPSWEESPCEVFLTFIRPETTSEITDEAWGNHAETWVKLCKPAGAFTTFTGAVRPLSHMTATEYVESDRLDLDHLSGFLDDE
jgi:hypothetical protein